VAIRTLSRPTGKPVSGMHRQFLVIEFDVLESFLNPVSGFVYFTDV